MIEAPDRAASYSTWNSDVPYSARMNTRRRSAPLPTRTAHMTLPWRLTNRLRYGGRGRGMSVITIPPAALAQRAFRVAVNFRLRSASHPVEYRSHAALPLGPPQLHAVSE